jgi:hypothetical protein
MEPLMKHMMNTLNFRMPILRMPKTSLNSLILILTLFSLTATVHAEEVPNYTIEVIVFENHALRGWTEEQWPSEIELPVIEGSTSLSTTGEPPLYLQEGKKSLEQVAKKMSRGYRILFHQAWSQKTVDSKKAPTAFIENDRVAGVNGTHILGTVRLYKTRFAHVEIDLEFEKGIPTRVREAFAANQQVALEDLPNHWRFTLKEARKIKEGQLHYIDHPLFGVLVQVHKND